MDQQQRQRWQRPGARASAPTTALRALLCFTLLGLCTAGYRPYQRGERSPQHPREPDRQAQRPTFLGDEQDGSQRVHFPLLSDEGYQRVQHPWVQDRGQAVQYPTFEDIADNAEIEVKEGLRRRGRVRGR